MIEQHGEQFLTRVFTPREMHYARDHKKSTERYGRSVGRQGSRAETLEVASVKALVWTDLEICHSAKDKATVQLAGSIKEKADRRRCVTSWWRRRTAGRTPRLTRSR